MKRSSSLDCSSIGNSLKRVKISTSPGELRLDRDIESLIFGEQWTSTANNNNPPVPKNDTWPRHNAVKSHSSSAFPSWDRRAGRIHGELYCRNARLLRDPVDPLRLRLTCLHQPMSPNNNVQSSWSSSSLPSPPERWTFLIQMPRMYPHVPPAITRVTREVVPNNENMAHLGNMNSNYYNSASATIVASSVMQSHVEPPVPEQVLIHPLPPTPNSDVYVSSTKLLDIDSATAIFNAWTPVSSLQDLIDFLMGIPARRREWWSSENNRRHHQEQQHFLKNYHDGTTPVGQPTIAPHQCQQQQQQNYQPFHNHKDQHQLSQSHFDMEYDGDTNDMESMMEDARHDFSGATPTERRANHPFTTNRFDVGYDRGAMIQQIQHHWRVR